MKTQLNSMLIWNHSFFDYRQHILRRQKGHTCLYQSPFFSLKKNCILHSHVIIYHLTRVLPSEIKVRNCSH